MENLLLSLETTIFICGSIIFFYVILNPEISFLYQNLSVKSIKLNSKLRSFSTLFSITLLITSILIHYNPSKMTEEQLFSNPIYREYRLDNCLYDGGKGCGLEAAIKWCRTQGFKTAVDFNVENISKIGMQTKRLGDDFVCSRGDICAGFTLIQCSK